MLKQQLVLRCQGIEELELLILFLAISCSSLYTNFDLRKTDMYWINPTPSDLSKALKVVCLS